MFYLMWAETGRLGRDHPWVNCLVTVCSVVRCLRESLHINHSSGNTVVIQSPFHQRERSYICFPSKCSSNMRRTARDYPPPSLHWADCLLTLAIKGIYSLLLTLQRHRAHWVNLWLAVCQRGQRGSIFTDCPLWQTTQPQIYSMSPMCLFTDVLVPLQSATHRGDGHGRGVWLFDFL